MDFSSSSRALSSLLRRKPDITHDGVLSLTRALLDAGGPYESVEDLTSFLTWGVEDRWEALAVGLYLSTEWLEGRSGGGSKVYAEGPRLPALNADDATTSDTTVVNAVFCGLLADVCVAQLEHPEPRVRTLVAKCVGAHGRVARAHREEPALRTQRTALYARITASLFAHVAEGRGDDDVIVLEDDDKTETDNTVAMDDTTGWKALETSLHALAAWSDAGLDDTDDAAALLSSLQHCAIEHVNRHVRAAALQATELLVTHSDSVDDATTTKLLTAVLVVSLADNWSQVRMAACTLCRTLLLTVEDPSVYYRELLPRMCLNRFYLAQGVKLYSQETWRLVLGDQGMRAVADNVGAVVRYYVKCCDADNHVVREAACQAVAELAQKVGTHPDYAPYLEPFVLTLLQVLLMCFHDESWPVRDQACLACGTFARAYPALTEPELPTLFDLWKTNLTDLIWSVREGAAVALGDAMCAYGEEFQADVVSELRRLLPGAKRQPAQTLAEYKARQNNIDTHTDSQLYSCGSLAPKLRKGGCSDCIVTRAKAPWEETDGCVYLLREVCGNSEIIGMDDETLSPLLEELADVARVRHFPQAEDLRTTVWKCLPEMARGLGKKRFKSNYLNMFLELLVGNLERGNATSEHAAEMCVYALGAVVGEGIFKGRVREVVGDDGVDVLERCCRSGRNGGHMGQGHGVAMSDSPFGPPMMGGVGGAVNTNGGMGMPASTVTVSNAAWGATAETF